MKIVRKKLTADEFSPANKRYVIETDMVQTSPDGGVTWYDDPGADPRHNPLNLLPARSGPDAQCDAAENMMQHFKAQVDAFLTGGSILAVVNVWLGLLLFIPGVNVIVALLLAVADALFTTGVVVIEAAMTDPVYDQIKCILFCHIDADGQMSAEQLAAVYGDIDLLIGGVAAEVFHQVTSAWGEVGFSNAGATGEATGDCDDCACAWCYVFDFEVSDGGFTGVSGSNWVEGQGWTGVDLGSGSRGWVYIHKEFDASDLIQVGMTFCKPAGSGGNNSVGTVLNLASVEQYINFPLGHVGCPDEFYWDVAVTADQAYFNVNSGDSVVTVYISKAVFRGTGVNPFGEDNC